MKTKNTGFDEIGLAYAKNHDEVEAARSAFMSQRQQILDRLVGACSADLAKTGHEFERGKLVGGWETIWITAKHAKARLDVANKAKYQSGICFGFDHDPSFVSHGGGCFGFGTYLLFGMGDKSYARLQATIAEIGLPIDYYGDESKAYVRGAWVLAGDARFRMDVFEEEAAKMSALFARADDVIATAYRKLKGG